MVPDDFREFFAATTGAAAALIGLLFVAISVAPQRLTDVQTRVAAQLAAGTALSAFTNVLLVSTIALIPGAGVGWVAVALGVGGLVFSAANIRLIVDAVRRGQNHLRSILLVSSLVVVFGYELAAGVTLLASPHNHGAVSTVAALLVASLAIGVARAWQLVGLRDTGLFTSVRTLLRGENPSADEGLT